MHGNVRFHAWKRMERKNVIVPCMELHGIQPIIWFHGIAWNLRALESGSHATAKFGYQYFVRM